MTRSIILWVALALCWVMTVSTADAQIPAAAATQSPSATPTATLLQHLLQHHHSPTVLLQRRQPMLKSPSEFGRTRTSTV